MDSAIIISDYLGEEADRVGAPEKGIVFSWSDISSHEINEDILVLDTKMKPSEDKIGESTAVGVTAHKSLEYFRRSLDNILKSGRTVVGLLSNRQDLYKTESRTRPVQNYQWLGLFDENTIEQGENDPEESFIYEHPESVFDLEVDLLERNDPVNTYFLNVTRAPVTLYPDNSSVKEFKTISTSPYNEEDVVSSMVIKSWIDADGSIIKPDGNLILLPRPTDLRIDAKEWFRSLIEIAHQFSSNTEGVDQFNRITNRTASPTLRKIYTICQRFPEVARQLENRYGDRPAIDISDEYDVQYLFHALLKLFFDDVREEETAPSHGGSSPRIDFLVKKETIAIEIKITRKGRGESELKKEIAEDKEHYRTHLDCDTLICFVYDPVFEAENPVGFENDISESVGKLDTEVIVSSARRVSGL